MVFNIGNIRLYKIVYLKCMVVVWYLFYCFRVCNFVYFWVFVFFIYSFFKMFELCLLLGKRVYIWYFLGVWMYFNMIGFNYV